MHRFIVAAVLLHLASSPTHAQVNLGFPKEPRHSAVVPGPGPGPFTGAALYAPKGAGPYPAIVLSHTCAGLYAHVFQWAQRAVEAGYVALIVDHFGPRKRRSNCGPDVISIDLIAQDAAAGIKHLRTLSFVDGKRIALMGFSMGAMAVLRAVGASFRKARLGGEPFAAAIAFYPSCGNSFASGRVEANFQSDIDIPLLLVLGDIDDETPSGPCVQQATTSAAEGRPVSWKVYPNTTHAFDGRSIMRRSWDGRTFHYRSNPKSVADAWRDSRDFLTRHLGAR